TFPTKTSMLALIDTLNNQLGVQGLDQRTMQSVFETYWPQFERDFNIILETVKPVSNIKPREDRDILGEILENTRGLSARIARLESERVLREVPKDRKRFTMKISNAQIAAARVMKKRGISDSEIIDNLDILETDKQMLRDMGLEGSILDPDFNDRSLH